MRKLDDKDAANFKEDVLAFTKKLIDQGPEACRAFIKQLLEETNYYETPDPEIGDEIFVWSKTNKKYDWNDSLYVATVTKVIDSAFEEKAALVEYEIVPGFGSAMSVYKHGSPYYTPNILVKTHPNNPKNKQHE